MIIVSAKNTPRFTSNFNIAALAGDPHFVGFDGELFDYHGEKGHSYLIYDDGELRVIARFDEPNLMISPHLAGMTFMTKLEVGNKIILPESVTEMPAEIIELQTGLVRGLPKEVEFVDGHVRGMEIIDFSKGQLIVTSMDRPGRQRRGQVATQSRSLYLNIAFKLDNIEFTATGILGQTLLPKDKRKPNDYYLIKT